MVRSPSRGRTDDSAAVAAKASVLKNPAILASGRGGAGNVRSPSRDPTDRAKLREAERRETDLQESYLREEAKAPHTSGRGGAGNLKREESQERGRGRQADGGSAAAANGGAAGVGNVSVCPEGGMS